MAKSGSGSKKNMKDQGAETKRTDRVSDPESEFSVDEALQAAPAERRPGITPSGDTRKRTDMDSESEFSVSRRLDASK
jgi:hypothetical protein